MRAAPLWALGGVLVLLAAAGITVDRSSPAPGTSRDLSISLAALHAVTLPDPRGIPYNLGKAQGKVLVLNFWATWCAPCLEEMPMLDDFFRNHANIDFDLVGI